ncbi:alpha/beta hydrolase [Mycobacterium sp. 236(2023)]|uniref:alpha/beta fold hydrolase n=1 Tax=Mycobacterium sp. 236(2023) TaxID=3038163 RepID=UPI002415145C|nr:alpha/beta hydrolase [Mycobacterium sp. 236(2023)]MDG4665887.1 alpha/beta hydrolase [Mycobacterium sp. 236(2023)]
MHPGLVLVHGACHGADCWEPTIDALSRLAPDVKVLAVDLPGRRGKPGELAGARIDDFADSVVADVNGAGFDDIVLVGHSMAGVTLPRVASRLGARRVKELVFAAAFVPPDGQCVIDLVPGVIGWYGRRNKNKRPAGALPAAIAKFAFCNGMTPEQRRFTAARWYPETASVPLENVDRRDMPAEIPRTWILTLRDRATTPRSQRASIAALGGVQTVIEMDTCHNMMISEPTRLAEILAERCRSHRP